MIVCSCFGTTDREIRRAFAQGGGGDCPAGRGCGGCAPLVEAIAREAGAPRESPECGGEAARRPVSLAS